MGLEFEWDSAKAAGNLAGHGASFDEAATAFADPMSLTIGDPGHSDEEDRYVLLGRSYRGRVLVVVHTERGHCVRIISARGATKRERAAYEEL